MPDRVAAPARAPGQAPGRGLGGLASAARPGGQWYPPPAVRLPPPRRHPHSSGPGILCVEPDNEPVHPPGEPSPGGSAHVSATEGVALALSTGLGVGFLPGAPGTYGSALALLVFVLFSPLPGGLLVVSVAALGAVGVWASDVAGEVFQVADDGRIVIDEIVGQLIALVPLRALAPAGGLAPSAELAGLVTAFVAFRCLDIGKPGPVGWAERSFERGVGVMMDDIVAGVLAAVLVALALPLLVMAFPGSAA